MTLPFQAITALFFRILGYLLSCMGARALAHKFQFIAETKENRFGSLIYGLCCFGSRFLVYSDNHGRAILKDLAAYREKGYCRGACYWLIEKSLLNPQISLADLAREFEGGIADEIARLHESGNLPNHLTEERQWAYRLTTEWNQILLALPQGAYTFRIGFWKNENEPMQSHRFALFRGKTSYLFDPSIGLVLFQIKDWIPQLERTARSLHPMPGGFFTIEAFRHQTTQGRL